MKSIDAYLCKEKKEVYKINTQPVIVNYAAMTKEAIEASNKQQELTNEYKRKRKESERVIWANALLVASGFW